MIRIFTPSDMDRILEIEAQAFPKSPYNRIIFTSLHRSHPTTFLVYEEEEILGYLVYTPEGHIISIAVDPRHRRKGIGTQLVREVFRNSTGDFIWVEVRETNTGAQAFYEKMAFRKKGVIPRYYWTEDAYIMVR
ncbi:MAG: ribosomal protein S18-alanine N-acetyltransferase [Syntrophobacterales bacterium]|nr:MAG: ribosomal protein S18-alanine N-acetyltransferase [Syntrophobacterales bacterium]